MYEWYQRLLQQYLQSRARKSVLDVLFIVPFMIAITLFTYLLTPIKRTHFPKRKTGGWWSIWRWRFEFLCGYLEHDTVNFFHRHIKPGMTVIDVGAHIGYFTRQFSDLVGPKGVVIAFEPFEDNRKSLVHNLRSKTHGNVVHIVPKAVGDKEEKRNLFLSKGHSAHSLISSSKTSEEVPVETISIDTYVDQNRLAKVDVMKIDAEGAEPSIIKGMRQTLHKNPNLIFVIECNEKALSLTGSTTRTLLSSIEQNGYDCLPLSRDISHKSGTQNYACLPHALRIINQVDYQASQYISKKRWFSYWYQIEEVLTASSGKNILEIGPGNNIVSHVLTGMGYSVKTADNDPKTHPDYQTDVRKISEVIHESFDIILCCQILEHIPFHAFVDTLQDLKKIGQETLILTLPYTSLGTFKPFLFMKALPYLKEIRWMQIFNVLPKEHTINRVDGHQWEIGKKGYPLKKILHDIERAGWEITKHYPIFENPYHYVFVCKNKTN